MKWLTIKKHGFDITRKEPAIQQLPVHLPGSNTPQFHHRNGNHSTTSLLDCYFLRADALHHLSYEQYYEQFVLYPYNPNSPLTDRDFIEKTSQGTIQKKASHHIHDIIIARVTSVPPNCGELFYLHALLLHHTATSFDDLHTIDNVLLPTFHEAATRLGLFTDEQEGHFMMEEAVESLRTPAQLHFLFYLIISEGYPAMPLWNDFCIPMSADHITRLHNNDLGFQATLNDIAHYLAPSHKKMSDFGLPDPIHRTREVADEIAYLDSHHSMFIAESDNLRMQLNAKQMNIFSTIYDTATRGTTSGFMAFIEGRPGRGKTFLIRALASTLHANDHIILIVGTSALSAIAYH
ncbi:hypothetical protein EDC04DRAFT_2909156 [Pisolithus marmoratus]|nr:hypothetical protein EDC04DRAFT_2909156 [Pisolithus marmoratus]